MVISTAQRIAESGIVTIIRETDPEMAIKTVDVLRRGGVPAVEITANTESVLNTTRDVSESLMADEMTIGAGIVLDAEMTRVMTLAGTEFIVMPSFDEGIAETADRHGVPSLVDIVTPTEVVNVFEAGVDMVKVFPAGMPGPRLTPALGGPLGHTPTAPIGGVGLDNVDEFFDAGVTAAGVGSSIVGTEVIACGEFDAIEANVCAFREAVKAVRSE